MVITSQAGHNKLSQIMWLTATLLLLLLLFVQVRRTEVQKYLVQKKSKYSGVQYAQLSGWMQSDSAIMTRSLLGLPG